jgi:hypothetical protein
MTELKACAAVFDGGPQLESFRRILIVRHVEAAEGVDSSKLIVNVVATLAMKEGPSLMLVDPREMPDDQQGSSRKLKGRSHTAALMSLGLVRMVCSLSVWGWNCEEEWMVNEYSYEALLTAKKAGTLDPVLQGLRPDEE